MSDRGRPAAGNGLERVDGEGAVDGEPSGEGRRVEGDELRIAGRARVERLLDRVAARLHAELEDLPALVGIRRRGFPSPVSWRVSSRPGRARRSRWGSSS